MFALIVISVIILVIAFVVYLEYKNEKEYQKERDKRKQERKKTKPPYDPKEKVEKPLLDKKESDKKRKEAIPTAREKNVKKQTSLDAYELKEHSDTDEVIASTIPPKRESKPSIQKEVPIVKKERTSPPKERKSVVAPQKETLEERIELPKGEYPKFNYERLIKMGLSDDEANEFIQELIPQIAAQIPLIKEALEKEDFHNMERLTHSIKGSSTTIGTGGISDLLVDFNVYLKTGTNADIAKTYFKHLEHYYEELKTQYPA